MAEEFRAQINGICKALGKNKIPLALIKESKFAYMNRPDFCSSEDIDILIKKSDMPRAAAALAGIGYNADFSCFSKDYLDRFSFHYIFKNPKHHFMVEVHWALIDRVFPFRLDEEILWGGRMQEIRNNVFTLEPEFEAIYLMASTVRDNGAPILKNTARVKRLLANSFDFNKFESYVRFHNMTEFADFFSGIWFNGRNIFGRRLSYRKILMKIFMGKKRETFSHFLFLLLLYPKNLFYYMRKGFYFSKIWTKLSKQRHQ